MLVPRDLSAVPPINPDLWICDPLYGLGIVPEDCLSLGNDELPHGAEPVPYHVDQPSEIHHLPFTIVRGTGDCAISVEIAGPDITGSASLDIAPDTIRGMAGYIIEECPTRVAGIGGFVTHGLSAYLSQLQYEDPLLDEFRAGTDLRFITLTVSGPRDRRKKPGDTDPDIAIALGDRVGENLYQMWNSGTRSGDTFRRFKQIMGRFYIRGSKMERSSGTSWWAPDQSPPNQMTYECDAKLGSPAVVDCTHLEYEGLKPAGAPDTVQIGPGLTKVSTSNSCNVVISAAHTITLAWSALQTAFETLVNICVEDPATSSRGGRAFYGAQSLDTYSGKRIFGRSSKVRAAGPITGLNALPPGLNMTVGSHADSTLLRCELTAAQQGRPISSCGTG